MLHNPIKIIPAEQKKQLIVPFITRRLFAQVLILVIGQRISPEASSKTKKNQQIQLYALFLTVFERAPYALWIDSCNIIV